MPDNGGYPNEGAAMYEATREQENTIANLALEHGSVAEVEVDEVFEVVKATAGGVNWLIDVNGRAEKAPPAYAVVSIPTEVLRAVLGDDLIDAKISEIAESDAFPEHTLGRALRDGLIARLPALAS